MTKRQLPIIKLIAVLAAAVFLTTFMAGCSLSGKADQTLKDAQAAKDDAQQQLTDAQQQITDLQAQVKDLKKQLADAKVAVTTSPSPAPTATSGAVYTPAAGSAERTAILDSVRKKINWKKLFVVHALKVQSGWAYAELEQTDPAKPDQTYEGFSAVCHQSGGSWVCLAALGGSDAVDIEDTSGLTLKEWLHKKYPAAPAAIFK